MSNAFSRFFRAFGRGGADPERMDQNGWAAEWMTFGGNGYPLGLMGSIDPDATHEEIGNSYIEYATGAYKSSGIVYGVSVARMLLFVEARFQYQALKKGRPGDLFGRPQLSILEEPWDNGTTADLLAKALQDTDLAGNHYVVTEGTGSNQRLRWLRPDWVDIILTDAPSRTSKVDVAGYVYKPGGTEDSEKWEIFPIDGSNGTVAHWAPIPDPEAQYRGMSWLTPVLTEVRTSKAISKNKNKFFDNAATPPIAISFKESVTPQQFKDFVKVLRRTHGGTDNAYKTLVLGGGADVKALGVHPVDFAAINQQSDHSICTAARVPPMIVGVSEEAAQRTPFNESNLQAAKDLFVDATMRPMWRSLANSYAVLVPKMKNSRLWYDDRDIPFLRQDRQAVAEIQQTNAKTLNSYITAGFTPESSILAIKHGDITYLEHTGLYSVQLQEPGSQNLPGPVDPNAIDANTPDNKSPGGNGDDSADPSEEE